MAVKASEIVEKFSDCMDFVKRDIIFKNTLFFKSAITLFYIETICNTDYISHYVVEPLSQLERNVSGKEEISHVIHAASFAEVPSTEQAAEHIAAGDAVVIFEAINCAIYLVARKLQTRSVEKTQFDTSLMGSYEGFNELLANNISLIRKRMLTEDFKIVGCKLGRKSKTQAAMLYMKGIAPDDLIRSVEKRLAAIDADFVQSIENVSEALSPSHSLFDTIGYTEKPEAVVSRLFEGRIAILVNGCSFALTAPFFFFESLQSADDYSSNMLLASTVRIFRLASLLVSLLLPALYTALTTHHVTLIPTAFAFKLAVSRAGVPFPTVVEVLLLFFFFELAREAGRRLPLQVGQALSIVGALILGDAAVGAGLTSQATVVVIGIYAITSFINARLAPATAVWAIFLIILSACFGLHGFYLGFLMVIAHLASLRSCDYPFLFPFGTAKSFRSANRDILVRSTLSKVSKPFVYKGKKDEKRH